MSTSNSHRGLAVGVLFAAIAQVLWPAQAAAQSLPTGFNGSTNVDAPTTSANTMTVNVTGPRAYTEWTSFNVANGYQFNVTNTSTPNSYIFVNRVTGGTFSSIDGLVQANGHIWLINPNGIAVGSTGVFDVGGLLLSSATTLEGETEATNGAAFLSNSSPFLQLAGAANSISVMPGAVINVDIGALTMLANTISISGGTFNAGSGEIALIGAQTAQIEFDADLNAISSLAVNVGSNQGTALSISGATQFSGARTILAANGMNDAQGNILLTDDNAANNITFQNGEVLLWAGRATTVVGGQVALNSAVNNQLFDQGSGAGSKITVNGTLSTPSNLQMYAGRGIGAAGTDLSIAAGGSLRLFSAANGRDVALQSGGTLTAGAISAQDDIVVRSGSSLTLGQMTSGTTVGGSGPVDAAGAADTLAGSALVGTDIDVSAGTSLANISARPLLGMNGDYRIAAGDFTGGGGLNPDFGAGTTNAFSIVDTSGGFLLGFTVTTPGDFSLSTTGGGGLTTLSPITSTTGSVTLNAGTGDLQINGNVTTGTGAGRSITLGGRTVTGAGVLTTNALNASAMQGIQLTGANAFFSGAFTNTGTGGVAVRSDTAGTLFTTATTGGGDVTLTANNGLRLAGSTVSTGSGNVTLGGATQLSGSNVVSTPNGTVTFSGTVDSNGAPANLAVTGAQSVFADNVGAVSALGAFSVSGPSRFDGINVYASNGITLGTVTATTAGSFTLDAGTGTLQTGDVSAADGNIIGRGADITMGTVSAGGPVTPSSVTAPLRTIDLNASSGDIRIAGGSAYTTSLVAGGAIDVTGGLSTVRLTGSAGGAATLTGNNQINSIGAFSSNGLTLRDISSLSVDGVVDAGAGDVRIEVIGDNLQIDPTGQIRGRDVALSSNTFFNQSGSDGVVASGHWVIYQQFVSPFALYDNLDSGQTAMWGRTINTLAPSAVTGNRYVFANTPVLTFSTTNTTKTYGTDLSGSAGSFYTVTGYQPGVAGAYLGDTAASAFSGAPTITSGGFATRATVAGGPYVINIANGSLTGLNGYAISLANPGRVTVNAKSLTGTPTATTKTYDGNANGSGTIALAGVVAGDTVGATGTFTFVDKNAGVGKTVNITGATLNGADAGNYTLNVPVSTIGDILQKAITGTVSVTTKTYDGNANGSGTITLSGVVSGDNLGATGTFTFGDKNAGIGKTVTVSAVTLTGTDAINYTVTVPASALGDILQKAITGTPTVTTKTYDGTNAGSGTIALSGVEAGDDLAASATFTFADKNAGVGKTVTLSGVSVTGADAGNYVVSLPASALGDILRKAISGTVTVNTKTYDGTTSATGSIALVGTVAGDDIGAAGTLAFADKNAGTGKTVNVTNAVLTGADASNYTLALPTTATGTVLQKNLTGTTTVTTKTYDGSTAATGSITVNGVVSGDAVGASGAFAFADKNTGTGKLVTVSGVTLTGADRGNYTTSVPATALGDILRKSITGTATVNGKTYDGTRTGTGSIALSGVVAGDTVGANGTYTFSDANAGSGKTVTVGGVSLTGADAGNYSVIVPGTTVADILRRAITVTANPGTKLEGTADPALTYGITQGTLVAGDTLSGNPVRTPGERAGQYTIGQGTLNASANYQLTFVGSTLTILPVFLDAVDSTGVATGVGQVVRHLDEAREAARRDTTPLDIVDQRDCNAADPRAGTCGAGRPR